MTLKCYYCGKKISHYSTESEVGDIYVLILAWRWRFSRNPITKLSPVMCSEAPLGAKRHTPVPFDEVPLDEVPFDKDAATELHHDVLKDEHIDTTESNDDDPAP